MAVAAELEVAAHQQITHAWWRDARKLNDDVRALVHAYHGKLGLSGDLPHFAFAVAFEMDYLVTWNCAHIANGEIVRRLREANAEMNRVALRARAYTRNHWLTLTDSVTPLFAALKRELSAMHRRSLEPNGVLETNAVDANGTEASHPEPVTVADYEALAAAKLPRVTFEYISTGSADEITLRDNVAAFRRLKLLPPLLAGVSHVDLSTSVLKQVVALPVLLAPVGGQRMYHPQGALAVARAAAAAGTVFAVSSHSFHSADEIAEAADGPKWFQLYAAKDREVNRRLVERVERAGYRAIVVTVDLGDWMDANRRNRFAVPRDMLAKHLHDFGFDQVTGRMSEPEVRAFNDRVWDLSLTWEFFDWLRTVTKLPVLLKGVLRAEDARKAVTIGLDGIIVSNHGGRRLDTVPASIEALPAVVEAVAGRVEVFMDGGVRRGSDVLKALALGAKAVLIGRPYAWALAAAGEQGVRTVLEMFRQELVNVMIAAGCSRVSDVNRSLIATCQ